MELRVGVERHACFASVAKSKTRSKHKRVIQSDQDVQVCGIFFWRVDELLRMISLSPCIFFLDMGYIFFLPFSFFRHVLWTCGIPSLGMHLFSFLGTLLFLCLLGMCHIFSGYASFISFCIAHILDGNLGERVMIELGVLFCEWMEMLAI